MLHRICRMHLYFGFICRTSLQPLRQLRTLTSVEYDLDLVDPIAALTLPRRRVTPTEKLCAGTQSVNQ